MTQLITNSPSGELVDLVVADNTERTAVIQDLTAAGVSLNKVLFHHIPHTDFWMRDYLVFVKDRASNGLGVVGFDFNGWAMGDASNYFSHISNTDKKIDVKIAAALNIPLISSNLIMEPGGLEFNGAGDLILSDAVILEYERNPGVTKAQADAELRRLFNVLNIIWLPKFRYNSVLQEEEVIPESDPAFYQRGGSGGLVADDSPFYGPLPNPHPAWFRPPGFEDPAFGQVVTALTTNGHTDEYVRWVSDDTVLVANLENAEVVGQAPNSIAARTKQRLDKIQSILSSSVNSRGERIKVVRIPTANEKIYYLRAGDATYDGIINMFVTTGPDAGKALTSYFPDDKAPFISARSYLNYVVTNDYVFMPRYADNDVAEEDQGLNEITSAMKEAAANAVLETSFGNSPKNETGKVRQVVVIGGG